MRIMSGPHSAGGRRGLGGNRRPHVSGDDRLDVLAPRFAQPLFGGLHATDSTPGSLRTSRSLSSEAATARMRSATAASPRHNAVSAARAGWPTPPAPLRSTAVALCEDTPTGAAMKRYPRRDTVSM